MTAEHARPMVAYLCLAVAAAMLLVQGVTVPRSVPGVSGVLGAVGGLEVGVALVVSPVRGADQVPAQATLGEAPARAVAEQTVVRASAAQAHGRRGSRAESPARGQRGASASATGPHLAPASVKASASAQKFHVQRPGKGKAQGKGKAVGSQRLSPREARAHQRSWLRAKVNGKAGAKGKLRARR